MTKKKGIKLAKVKIRKIRRINLKTRNLW